MSSRPRPLSPHLQVYRPQLTSVLSILHRITGLLLSAAAIGLAWGLLALAAGRDSFHDYTAALGSLPGRVLLALVVFALLYHWANGIRHLVWDAGYGFDLKTTYRSGWLVVGVSVLGTAALLALWFGGVGGAP